ncbi:putative membrane protein [Cyanobacterium sp. HL-69]|uniref:hypothetical protein n=1 Tax=Cyanobacterium sp. HL-69 TaxID=2054282 RepID=UPI000CA1E4F0|nr:putative membrane protein [Cyanobacterium sp. HL-69]
MLFKQYFIFLLVKILLIKITIACLFFVPALDLLTKVFVNSDLSYRFLCGGLLLFCLEQCKMAIIDLRDYFVVKTNIKYHNISFYFTILCSTIALELIGFYYMYFYINIGAIITLISQLWFNSLAKIKINIFREQITIIPWGIEKRIGELIGAILGITLIILWSLNIYPLTMGFLMLTMMIAFLTIKYGLPMVMKNS